MRITYFVKTSQKENMFRVETHLAKVYFLQLKTGLYSLWVKSARKDR